MRRILTVLGRIAWWCAWPAYWVYFKRGHGRTRVVIARGSDVLVMKQWIGNGKWQLPGGGIHANEQPIDAARRELYEETGLWLRADQLKPHGMARYRARGLVFDFYVFSSAVNDFELRLQKYEVSELRWMNHSELNATNASGDVLTSLQMVQ